MRRSSLLISLVGALTASVASGQNLLANPDFDQDGSGWELFAGSGWSWQEIDEGACPASGSAQVASSPDLGPEIAILRQCVPAALLPAVTASVSYRGGGSWNVLYVIFHLSANCSDASPPFSGSDIGDPSPGAWARLEVPPSAVPAGTLSLEFRVGGTYGDPFVVEVDRSYLGVAGRIFAGDFEADEEGSTQPCRWSAVLPEF